MSVTLETFGNEHFAALEHLKKLGEALRGLQEGRKPAEVRETLEGFAAFLEHALKSHFRQEEEALFPVLGRVIGTRGGPIAVMLLEHKQIEASHADFSAELQKEQPDPGKLNRAGSSIISVLTPHIEKENNILFPMARQHLSPEQLAEVDLLAMGKASCC
ncbi:MAG: hemerythrin domain-containing protein [Actinobacteria bacterium]|nr:hemerythrin domain-containing protein [Actinomycetota bacterium]